MSYRLGQLGWLQFERLCSLVVEAETGLSIRGWRGHPDVGRFASCEESVVLPGFGVRLAGPVTIVVAWARDDAPDSSRPSLAERMSILSRESGFSLADRLLVFTNLEGKEPQRALADDPLLGAVALGAGELADALDRHLWLRAAMPSVLGWRDLGLLVDASVMDRSSLDISEAQSLARVFVSTAAYERARQVLARHRFVVLTGPPEMGKTAIAQMIALAQLTGGWEAHECTSPEQLWSVFDRDRSQVFVADDAFGSTEYRPDAAERWAREMGRMLSKLDERHWLIWTSRPAPLKAGLRRVQRERGSERFPAPGEVLVDASDLDLAEKTLILFRHAKDHGAGEVTRRVVRSAGHQIVEHPHFTPERIRRFVATRLDSLRPALARDGDQAVVRLIERELATPTDAMTASYRALGPEHRALLIALLDTPVGLVDERELTGVVRRHHPSGLSRPAAELIDRLTDHFLRITSMGIGWVHPSWRDLVIGELAVQSEARQRFLAACGPHGAMLVLSCEGGIVGERTLPLLGDDGDWDLFTDRVRQLLRDVEDQDVARLLLAIGGALGADIDPPSRLEMQALAHYVLRTTRRTWDRQDRSLPLFLLQAWYALNESLPGSEDLPLVDATWIDLHPGPLRPDFGPKELARAEEWLTLASTLAAHDARALATLGFPEGDRQSIESLIGSAEALGASADRDLRSLAERILAQVHDLVPACALRADRAIAGVQLAPPPEDRWWVPEDLAAPPTTERVAAVSQAFTRADVEQVLSDL